MEKLTVLATDKKVAPLFENRIVCEWLSSGEADFMNMV